MGFGETLELTGFMLHDADKEVAGHTRVESSGSAGDNICPVLVSNAILHGEMVAENPFHSIAEIGVIGKAKATPYR